VLSVVTTSLLVCVVKLFIWYVAVCCLCVCVPDVLVCGMFGCETIHPTDKYTSHNCLTISSGPSFMLNAVTTSLIFCVVKIFIWYVALCGLGLCVPDVLVFGMFGCGTKHPIDKYIRHAHTYTTYSHIPNKQLDDANKQKSSNSIKHERRPPEDGHIIVTERCSVLIMCFTNIFNILVF